MRAQTSQPSGEKWPSPSWPLKSGLGPWACPLGLGRYAAGLVGELLDRVEVVQPDGFEDVRDFPRVETRLALAVTATWLTQGRGPRGRGSAGSGKTG